MKQRMWLLGVVVFVGLSYGPPARAETSRLQDGGQWQSGAAGPQERYVHAIAELRTLAREGDSRAIKEALQRVKEEFPDRAGPDLELFIYGELRYWQDRYTQALTKFEKLWKDYPRSEYARPALEREFDMAQDYLGGRKIVILGILKLSGAAEGVEMMERISDRAGLDERDGVGLKAAIAVAEHYEAKDRYIEAYLKWSEIASYWETGPVAKRATYRMAEDNLAAYNRRPPAKRAYYDASKLVTARTYYAKFLALYPEEAREKEVPEKIRQIDEQVAYKQFTIGEYYRRTGKPQAANLYYDMVVRNWPQTEAANRAREAREKSLEGRPAGGK